MRKVCIRAPLTVSSSVCSLLQKMQSWYNVSMCAAFGKGLWLSARGCADAVAFHGPRWKAQSAQR